MTDTSKEAVKRWQPHSEYEPDEIWMGAQNDGDWVRFEDYKTLLAERDALEAERDFQTERLRISLERAEGAEDERDALKAENERLREALGQQTTKRAQHFLRRNLRAPGDAEVKALCEKHGYGAVMDAASRLWARTEFGSAAFYVGGCIGVWTDEEAQAALKGES